MRHQGLDDFREVPGHMEGLAADNAVTFLSWRHPYFLELVEKFRAEPTRALGVVNGCFDLMHLGHVNLIQQAWDFEPVGGRRIFLIALLNSDESARRLKGLHRPYTPLAARMWTLAMVRGVQAAAGFDEDTPAEALAALKPDFLFKGSEYEGTAVPGAEHCGRVVFLPETPGFRTTEIEKRIVAAAGRSV